MLVSVVGMVLEARDSTMNRHTHTLRTHAPTVARVTQQSDAVAEVVITMEITFHCKLTRSYAVVAPTRQGYPAW